MHSTNSQYLFVLILTLTFSFFLAENSGVPEKIIANDALGLLREEVNGKHKELLIEVFSFLKDASVKTNTSELTGCNLPLKLLPVFFEVEVENKKNGIYPYLVSFFLYLSQVNSKKSGFWWNDKAVEAQGYGLKKLGKNELMYFLSNFFLWVFFSKQFLAQNIFIAEFFLRGIDLQTRAPCWISSTVFLGKIIF